MRVPVALYPCQQLVLIRFWGFSHFNRCTVVSHGGFILTCNSLMACGVEYLFMFPYSICVSSLVRCLFRSSTHFETWWFPRCWVLYQLLFHCVFLCLKMSLFSFILECILVWWLFPISTFTTSFHCQVASVVADAESVVSLTIVPLS